jgi:TonB family protein
MFRELRHPLAGRAATASADLTAVDLDTFAEEYADDDRVLRRALGAAFATHLLLLAVQLPAIGGPARADQSDREPFFVVQPPSFRPPEPSPEVPPHREVLRVPVPDPTPDAPEPLAPPAREPVEPWLPDPSQVFGIPASPPPAEAAPPIEIVPGVVPPERIYAPRPAYTEAARLARIEGLMVLRAIIDRQGRVRDVQVVRGLPLGLVESAVSTVGRWRYRPATRDNRPVEVYLTITIHFGLR